MAEAAPARRVAAGDAAALVAILVLVALAGWRSLGYGVWSYGEPGPGLFPFLVCALAGICGVVALAATLAGDAPAAEIDPDAAQQEGPMMWGKLALYVGVIAAWPWLMAPLGFVLSTAAALFVVLRLAEGMAWGPAAAVLVGTVGASWLVFERILGVPLPHGLLGVG
ncbi:MAG: tripartite tricarboxylate transporter TctB family protein [Alphaproteobacteria bacterium]|nr:tripartite tricarboxylate transporter TctB family protein [Alphaproteobacteria bacterium]